MNIAAGLRSCAHGGTRRAILAGMRGGGGRAVTLATSSYVGKDAGAELSRETLLTRAEASIFLEGRGIRMKPTTLARAYSTGSGGPPCRHIRNKPYYPLDLLEGWAETQITAPAASSSERQRLKREAKQWGAGS
jgi:hypothetical protein